jgi:hypothetical protein
MPKIEYLVTVYMADEYVDDFPTHARIVLDKKIIDRIYKLKRAIESVNAYVIEDYDGTPDLLAENDDGEKEEWDGAAGAMWLSVERDVFKWVFYIKHTEIRCSTESISFDELRENRKILRARVFDLPRLAVSEMEYDSSKVLIEKRLKGE